MKKSILVFTAFVFTVPVKQSFSQNDLVLFSEQGEQFYVVIDGVKQNAKPETNVKITGLKQPMVTAKVIFGDGKTPDVDQKIYFMWEAENKNGWEFTYAIVKKGEAYKIKPRSAAQIAQVPPPAGQTVVVYSATPPPPASTGVTETTTITTTTTTGGAAPSGTGENVNVNMNMGGMGVNMNVSVTEGAASSTSTTSTSVTTTTSTTTTTSGAAVVPPPTQPVYVLPGYNGPYGCPMPMSDADFASAKTSIKSKSFEDSKLTVAKQILGSNCMLSSQVKEVMMLFDFENTRLDFAKFAYGKTYDPGNYYKLNDAFDFESSIDELNKHINSGK